LRTGVETGNQLVELDGAKREKGSDVQVDTGAQSGGEGIVARGENVYGNAVAGRRAGADGLMRNAEQGVNKRRNFRRESQFRPEEIRLYVDGTGASDRSVVAAEVRSDSDERKKFVGGREFITIQVWMFGHGTRYGRASKRAGAGLLVSDRRPEIGVTDEEFELFLRANRKGENRCGNGAKSEPAECFEH
jgi:hypothetical protein